MTVSVAPTMVLPDPRALRSRPRISTRAPRLPLNVNRVVGSVAPVIAEAVFFQMSSPTTEMDWLALPNCTVVLSRSTDEPPAAVPPIEIREPVFVFPRRSAQFLNLCDRSATEVMTDMVALVDESPLVKMMPSYRMKFPTKLTVPLPVVDTVAVV